MDHEITDERYQEIEREIASDSSPVGIDAKKTHVLILHKLEEIDRRLRRLEAAGPGGAGGKSTGEGIDR